MASQSVVSPPVFAEDAQRALESRAQARWSQVGRGELTPEQAMGTMNEWQLEIGNRRLLLVPSTGEWLYHDPIHDTFEPTGYRAGQGQFFVIDGRLGLRPVRSARTASSPPPAAPPSARVRRFCESCGTAVREGARFCGSCGRPLEG